MRITLKGLAQYMTAGAASQRKILADFKYPVPEGRAKALYYADAARTIKTFHSQRNDPGVLVREAARLGTRAAQSEGATSRRLRDNASGLIQYATHFASKAYETLPEMRLTLQYGPVTVAVTPDLHVKERGEEKILKLEFSKEPPSKVMVRIITQGMFEAADQAGIRLRSSGVLYLDVRRGEVHGGARIGARLARNIEATCRTIADIWESL